MSRATKATIGRGVMGTHYWNVEFDTDLVNLDDLDALARHLDDLCEKLDSVPESLEQEVPAL